MAAITSFLTDVLIEVPNCPQTVALNAINNALTQFCKKSRFWTAEIVPIDIAIDQHTYNLVTPISGSQIHEIYHARAFGQELSPASADQLDLMWPEIVSGYRGYSADYGGNVGYKGSGYSTPWREYKAAQPWIYHQPTRATVRLIGIPQKAEVGGLKATVALYPTPTAMTVDDLLFDEWREVIGFGAKARLMIMPGRDWSSPDHAEVYGALFEKGIADAKGERIRDFARNNRSVIRTRAYY